MYVTIIINKYFSQSSGALQYVLPPGLTQSDDPVKLSLAEWIPSDDPGLNRLVFVYQNDVHVKLEFDDDASVSAVTTDGQVRGAEEL